MEKSDERIKELEEELKRHREFEEQLAALLGQDPRLLEFIGEWADGNHPIVGLVKRYGKEFLTEMGTPEFETRLEEAEKSYKARREEEEKLEEEFNANLAVSVAAIKEYAEKEGLSEEETKSLLSRAIEMVRNALSGRFLAEDLKRMRLADGFETAIARAREEGILEGRNTKIEQLMSDSPLERCANLPHYASIPPREESRGESIFTLARGAN